MADRRLAAVRDDELVRGRPVVAERPLDGLLDPLARELLPVEHELARGAIGRAQELETRAQAGLGGTAGPANPLELGLVLDAAAPGELRLVDRQLDPARAEIVGVAGREGRRHDGALHAEPASRGEPDLPPELRLGEAARDQLVVPELLERVHLEIGSEVVDPSLLHRADRHEALAADLRVEQRIGDRDRHLVPQLGAAHRVADDQGVGHRPRS